MDSRVENAAVSPQTVSISFDKTRGNIYDRKLRPLVNAEKEFVAVGVLTEKNKAEILACPFLDKEGKESLKMRKPFALKCERENLKIDGVTVFAVDKRYGNELGLSHVIGYLDGEGRGVSGIEAGYDEFLSGVSETSRVYFNADGQGSLFGTTPAEISLASPTTAGVVLTVDSRIQKICEEVGSKHIKKGAVVVMEPETGKLLAVASFPDFEIESLGEAVSDSENTPLINRAFYPYSVGSCFKIATAAAALEKGLSQNFRYDCEGKIEISGQEFRCHNQSGHGELRMTEAMGLSCNPYFIELSSRLNSDEIINMAEDLSFGKSFELAKGIRTKSGYLQNEEDLINPAEKANLSFGQGKLTASPVQLALMMSAVVNGGKTPYPTLIEGYTQNGVYLSEREEVRPPILAMSEKTADKIKNMLIFAVNEVENQNALPRYVSAGGKTGTAQTGRFDSEGNELLQGWFAGFFPAEDPLYIVVVLSENAKSGNRDASPVFREIADRLYEPRTLPEELKSSE